MTSDDGSFTFHPFLSPIDDPSPRMWYVVDGGDGPERRLGHGCVVIDEEGSKCSSVLIGGGANPGQQFEDLWVLDLDQMIWKKQACTGDKPSQRYENAFVGWQGRAYAIGGAGPGHNLNDVVELDTAAWKWTSAKILTGTPPSPRTIHTAATLLNGSIYIFGGGDQGTNPVSDTKVHRFNPEDKSWSQPATIGSPPTPRLGHSVCAIDTSLVVFGGMAGGQFFNDLYALRTDKMEWEKLETTGTSPSARTGHSVAVIENVMYVFGGMTVSGGAPIAMDDLYALDFATKKWTIIKHESAPIAPRLGHTMRVITVTKHLPPDEKDKGDADSSDVNDNKPVIADVTEMLAPGVNVKQRSNDVTESLQNLSLDPDAESFKCLCVFGGMDTMGNIYDDCLVFRPS